MKYKYVLKKYCDEIEKVENYDLAKADNFKGWVVHHRLEISVNGEEVITPEELDRLGMYYHRPYFELIFMRRKDHATLHNLANPRNTEEIRKKTSESVKRAYSEGRIDTSGEKNGMYGRTGNMCPTYGLTGDKSPCWKGDNASVRTLYYRAKERFKAGEITEEEFQPFRDAWAERARNKRKRMKNRSSSV